MVDRWHASSMSHAVTRDRTCDTVKTVGITQNNVQQKKIVSHFHNQTQQDMGHRQCKDIARHNMNMEYGRGQ